jgi:hypothetical protein
MDILRTWVDSESKEERAKLYRNIDPESICIVGHTIYFAHVGCHKKGTTTTSEHYRIELTGCPFLVTDPEVIKQEMKRFNFTGDLGYYNQTANCKEDGHDRE